MDIVYIYIYIYIYTCNAWALPRRCSVEVSHSQTNDVAITVIPIGKITQVLETIKQTSSKHRNSYGKNKNDITPAIPMGKTTKVLGNFKLSNRET